MVYTVLTAYRVHFVVFSNDNYKFMYQDNYNTCDVEIWKWYWYIIHCFFFAYFGVSVTIETGVIDPIVMALSF